MRRLGIALVILIVLGAGGCGYDDEQPLFMAPGSYGDIAIVVSDAALASGLGEFEAALNQEFTFVLAREKLYNIDVYTPDQLKLCRGYKNIIFFWRVGDGGPVEKELRKLLTEEAQRLADSGSGQRIILDEPYASYQLGIVLAATDRNSLLSYGRREAADLREYLERKSSERIMRRYRYEGLNSDLMAQIWIKHRFFMEIPAAFKLNQDRPDGYPAVEFMRTGPSRGITVAWSQSVDPALVADYKPLLVELRREMGAKMHQEEIVVDSLVWSEDTVGDLPALRLEGAWNAQNFDGGGPFWSWFIADHENQRVICIDALCYAPGMEKMDYFRRLRSIVQTFSLERPQP